MLTTVLIYLAFTSVGVAGGYAWAWRSNRNTIAVLTEANKQLYDEQKLLVEAVIKDEV